jgi:hypothetical protein
MFQEELAELAKAENESKKTEFMKANSQAPIAKQPGKWMVYFYSKGKIDNSKIIKIHGNF